MSNKLTLKILFYFQSIAFALSQVWGFRLVIGQSTSTGLMPILNFSDSSLYLSQLNAVLLGNTNFPLWFIYEHQGFGGSPASNPIYLFWGLLGKLFGEGIFETYLAMTFLSSLITYFAIDCLLNNLDINFKQRLLFTPIIAIFGIGYGLGRPSPTQLTLCLLIIGLTEVTRKEERFLRINLWGILLLITNPLYAIVFIFFLGLTFIAYRRLSFNNIFKIIPLAISSVLFVSHQESQSDNPVLPRFGIVSSHLPGAIRPTLLLIAITTILILISRNRQNINVKRIVLLNFAVIFAINSQIISGKVFEMESHFRYAVNLMLGISSIQILNCSIQKKIFPRLLSPIIVTLMTLIWTISWPSSINARVYTQQELKILKELKNSKYLNKVFLVKQNQVENDFYRFLPLNSDIKLYWHPDLTFYNLSHDEIINRYGCAIDEKYSWRNFLEDRSLIYGHKFENLKQLSKKEKYFSLGKSPDYNLLELNQSRSDFHKLKDIYYSCTQNDPKYEIDYLLMHNKPLQYK